MITFPRENLLAALSSFWLNLFRDDEVIENLYNSNLNLMGEAYLDLLESVLSRRLEDVPVFGKRYWQVVDFDLNGLFWDPTYNVDFPYVLELPPELQIVEFNTLSNQVLNPTVTLERNIDFVIRLDPVPNTIQYRTFVHFAEDPFSTLEEGETFANSARIWTPLEKKAFKEGFHGLAVASNAITDPEVTFDELDVHKQLEILDGPNAGLYDIIDVTTSGNTLSLSPDLEYSATDFHWQVVSPPENWRFVFWAQNVLIDKKTLAEQYGALISRFEPSSETYKEFLKGIFNFFANGPDVARLEAALNVMIGYPLIQEDGEILQNFEQDAVEGLDIVTTNRNVYTLPLDESRADIQDPGNFGVLTFVAFEPLSNKFSVYDATDDPTWWHGLRVPSRFMPGEPIARRRAFPGVYPFLCGVLHHDAEFRCGDLGLRCGADSNGYIPDPELRPPLAFKHSYLLLEGFIKRHMFGVVIQGIETLPRAEADLVAIILAGKPAHTYMWYEPQAELEDSFTLLEYDVDLEATLEMEEEHCPKIESTLFCGEPGLVVQQYFYYTDGPPPGIEVDEGEGDLSLGHVPLVCGGASPFRLPGYTSSTTRGIGDWPASLEVDTI